MLYYIMKDLFKDMIDVVRNSLVYRGRLVERLMENWFLLFYMFFFLFLLI